MRWKSHVRFGGQAREKGEQECSYRPLVPSLLDDQGAGRGPPPGLEPGPTQRRSRPRLPPQAHPLLALEEPREPDRQAAPQAGLGGAAQPAALPGPPPQRAPRAPRSARRPGGPRCPPPACRSRSAKLWAARTLRRRRGWEQPRQRRTDRHCQTVRARQARRNGARTEKPAVKPPQAFNQLQPGGYGLGSHARALEKFGQRLRHGAKMGLCGGHEESLRRTGGKAAGKSWAPTPPTGRVTNVGTSTGPPARRLARSMKGRIVVIQELGGGAESP